MMLFVALDNIVKERIMKLYIMYTQASSNLLSVAISNSFCRRITFLAKVVISYISYSTVYTILHVAAIVIVPKRNRSKKDHGRKRNLHVCSWSSEHNKAVIQEKRKTKMEVLFSGEFHFVCLAFTC
jgi:hypothetical protein